MNRQELLEKIKLYPNTKKLPFYVEVEDIHDGMLLIDNKWMNYQYAWGIIDHEGKWIFFLTDEERGYVTAAYSFNTEAEACEYAAERLLIKAKSLTGTNPTEELVRSIQQRFNYTEEYAAKAVFYLLETPDIFDEFYMYIQNESFSSENAIRESGYTAKEICKSFNATPLEAYIYLAYLRKDPETALKRLNQHE